MNKLKLIAFSDPHGYLPQDIPKCDIVIIAGDILPLDIQRDDVKAISWFLLEFKPWAESLNCDKVIFTAGNHDFLFDHLGPQLGHSASDVMKKLLGNHKKTSKLVYLCNSSYEYKGRRFFGFPWCPELSNWAFYKSDDDMEKMCEIIPKKCDVLIAHCPPSIGSTGIVHQPGYNYMTNYGSIRLSEAIIFRDIKWLICGHIHSGNHVPETINYTNIVNVSIKDEDYKVNYNLFEFEL